MKIVSLKYLFYNKYLIETLDEYICKHIISNLKTKIFTKYLFIRFAKFLLFVWIFFRKNFTFRKKN